MLVNFLTCKKLNLNINQVIFFSPVFGVCLDYCSGPCVRTRCVVTVPQEGGIYVLFSSFFFLYLYHLMARSRKMFILHYLRFLNSTKMFLYFSGDLGRMNQALFVS